jgi:hypothetical protein
MSRLGAVLSTRIRPSVRTVALLVPPLLVTGETAEQRGGAKPARNEASTHRDKLGAGIRQSQDVNRCGRGNIVTGLQVACG